MFNAGVSEPEKQVVYVITSLAMGGAQNVLLQLLQGRPAGYQPLCVVSLRREPGIEEKVRTLGVDVLHLELNKPWRLFFHLFRLGRYLRGHKVDLLFSIMPHANLLGVLLKLFSGGRWRLIWSLHNTPQPGLYPRWDHRFLLWLSCKAVRVFPEKVIVVSKRSRDSYVALGYPPDKLLLIQNGVAIPDTSVAHRQSCRQQIRQALGLEQQAVLIGSLTRYVPAKNIPLMLEAFRLLLNHDQSRESTPLYLLLAGENMVSDNAELQDLLIRYRLTERVLLLGIRNDAPLLIQGLDIATLSSVSESFPLFMIEAMAAGVPCVATDVGGIAELFGDSGFLVEPGSAGALLNGWLCALGLSETERENMTELARQQVEQRFGVQQMIDAYTAVFNSRYQSPGR